MWLKNWAFHAHFKISKFKIEKGVASSIFEPCPWNFRKWCIILRCSNDITFIFQYLHWAKNELWTNSEKNSKLKRAWQAQIPSYTLVTLRKNVFLQDFWMILVSIIDIFNTSLTITTFCSTGTYGPPCINIARLYTCIRASVCHS